MNATTQQLYPFLMLTAVLTGFLLSRRTQQGLPLNGRQRFWIALWAFSGAMLAAKLPFMLLDPAGLQDGSTLVLSGRTILPGLAGGYFGVEFAKWYLGLRIKTGDSFAAPVAVSIAIGRVACFCGGCCYGIPTGLPWGVVFVTADHLRRHPTQLYEATFHAAAAIGLLVMRRRGLFRGQLIKLYFLSYFAYRFVSEFLRPEEVVAAGLTSYQWAAAGLFVVFAWLWRRDAIQFRAQHAGDSACGIVPPSVASPAEASRVTRHGHDSTGPAADRSVSG